MLSALSTKQILPTFSTHNTQKNKIQLSKHNKRFKRGSQRVAFPVPMSRGGYGCCF
ncbi:hypothetical protein GTP19_16150 [Vibrio cholerae]|nr:hypothetical protein [Vibrio cholerae]